MAISLTHCEIVASLPKQLSQYNAHGQNTSGGTTMQERASAMNGLNYEIRPLTQYCLRLGQRKVQTSPTGLHWLSVLAASLAVVLEIKTLDEKDRPLRNVPQFQSMVRSWFHAASPSTPEIEFEHETKGLCPGGPSPSGCKHIQCVRQRLLT
eukprot:1323483-Amphidinium_carterae.1